MKKIAAFIFLCLAISLYTKAQTRKQVLQWVASAINSYAWTDQYMPCRAANGDDYAKRVQIMADTTLMEITAKVQTSFMGGSSSYVEIKNSFSNLVSAEVCTRCLSCAGQAPIKLVFKKDTMKLLRLEGGAATPDVIFLFLQWDGEADLEDKMVKALNQLTDGAKP